MYSIPYQDRPKQLELIQAVEDYRKNNEGALPLAEDLAKTMGISRDLVYQRSNALSKITGKEYFRRLEESERVAKIKKGRGY